MVLSSPYLFASRHAGGRRRNGAPDHGRVTVRPAPAPDVREPARRARRAAEEAEAYLAERRSVLRQRRGR